MFTRFLFKPHESIKVILAILLSVIIITSFSSCAIKNNSEQNHLVYYTLNDEDALSWITEKYNKYCINSNNPSFQVEIVKFDSEQEMSTQISTEIMAGSGPDIISLSQKLPFEKLIESRSLMNIYDLLKDDNSSNAINLDDYNVNILNAGVYDNGLYIVPLFYGVDVLVSTEERLKNFDIKENNGFSLTYSNFSDVFENYFLNPEIMSKLGVIESEDAFYEILYDKWREYLHRIKSGVHLMQMIGRDFTSAQDMKEHMEEIKTYMRGHNLFDIFYGRYKKEEKDLLKKYIEIAPRDEFSDILDAADSFIYFQSKTKQKDIQNETK